MNHSEFIEKIKSYGFVVEIETQRGTSDFQLCVNGIMVSKPNYSFFGYYCGGAYAQCNRTQQDEFSETDLRAAILICSNSIMEAMVDQSKELDYFDIIDFLNTKSKTIIEKDAKKRILTLLKDNYQNIYRSKNNGKIDLK